MSNIEQSIEELVRSFNQLPYLFVGTGLSMRYSTAPSWDKLLIDTWYKINGENEMNYKRMVKKLVYNLGLNSKDIGEEDRKYYVNPQIASEIQKEFNEKFFCDKSFEESIFTKEELDDIYSNDYDPFKYYIALQTKELKIDTTRGEYKEIISLKNNQNKIAGIITTNYDNILENIFTDFDILVGQDNLLVSNTNNIFEIYKIHGSSEDPSSIVLTQEDYEYFKNKLKYLSAKLLTLFVEHPIIFIGYGVGDLNVREILKEIAECLNTVQLEKLKKNLIFVNPSFGKEEEITSKEIEFDGRSISMTQITLNDFSTLYSALSIIKSSMSVKIMRKMQDMFCNFIATTDATKNVIVNVNNTTVEDGELGIYFGNVKVVSDMGFDYYGIEDIIEDILFDNKPNLMNIKLVDKTFNRIRSIASKTYLPIYKYISGLGLDASYIQDNWHIIKNITDIKLTTTEKGYTSEKQEYHSISDIIDMYPDHLPKQLAYILYNINNINEEDLGEYLREKYNDSVCMSKYKSTIKKLVAIYDFMKYKSI